MNPGSPEASRCIRKIIRIRADQSPNVRLALIQQAKGREPTNEIIVPGVLSWADYRRRLATWDAVRISIGLNAEFWLGADALLFPPTWLDRAEAVARDRANKKNRTAARSIGIDPAEGGDKTAMCAGDEYGVLELVSRPTPDTDVVYQEAVAFMLKWGVDPRNVLWDAGGGGKQHADRMRARGYAVRTVAFGGKPAPDPAPAGPTRADREDAAERKTAYVNTRAQMYGEASALLDPAAGGVEMYEYTVGAGGFGIPAEYAELRRQLAPIPKLWDEGRLRLLPKSRKGKAGTEKTLTDLIGHSPDEADAFVLMVHGMLHPEAEFTAEPIFLD